MPVAKGLPRSCVANSSSPLAPPSGSGQYHHAPAAAPSSNSRSTTRRNRRFPFDIFPSTFPLDVVCFPQAAVLAAAAALLAPIYRASGQYARALPLAEHAAKFRKEARGDQHPDYADSLHLLAQLHHARGDDKKARPLFEQGLAIRGKALGEKHP